MSLGKHLKSHCNTPSAASRDPCGFQGPISWLPGTHIVAGTLIIRRTVKWSHPSLQPLLILQEETTTFSPSCNPSRRLVKSRPGRTNWGLGAGRAGRSSAESPRLVLVFLWPPLRGLDVGAGPPHGGLPLARGSRYFPMGLTSDTSPPLSTATCPRGFLRGLQCYILTPTSLAGRGRDPGGLALQFGIHRKFGDRISSSSPHRHAPCTMSPIPGRPRAPGRGPGGAGSSPGPSRAPHLPSLPGPQAAAPCMPQKALRSCMLSWTVASDHSRERLVSVLPGVVALGPQREHA